jgi:hypothetical protein
MRTIGLGAALSMVLATGGALAAAKTAHAPAPSSVSSGFV